MIASTALLLAQVASPATVTIRVEQVEERCRIVIGDRTFDVQQEGKALNDALAALPADQPVSVVGGTATPYRCIGGAIYTMQINGVRKIGFTSEPPEPTSQE